MLKAGGIVATTLDTGQQWDAPNGWAPLQWIAVAGLTNFGRSLLAAKVACRWRVDVSRVYRQTGKLLEKYDVIAADRPGAGGEYPTQDGFGWTPSRMIRKKEPFQPPRRPRVQIVSTFLTSCQEVCRSPVHGQA